MNLSLFLGVIFGSIGSLAVLKTLHKREVIKLKKYFSGQQESFNTELEEKIESFNQLVHDREASHNLELLQFQEQLQRITADKEALAQQLVDVRSHDQFMTGQQAKSSDEIEALQQQLHQQIAEKENVIIQLAKEKEKTKVRQQELRASSKDIDELLDFFEKEQQAILATKNQEIESLKEENRDLAIDLEQLKSELYMIKQTNNQNNLATAENPGNSLWSPAQVTELLETLFPGIVLLRDSINVLTVNSENLVKLIKAIKDIYDGHPYSPTKVRATDKKWTECRVPHINLMRIYFQKCKKDSGYQILISPKKNQKSQDQDYEWLKNHQTC